VPRGDRRRRIQPSWQALQVTNRQHSDTRRQRFLDPVVESLIPPHDHCPCFLIRWIGISIVEDRTRASS
jgi:hypothetical protein